ncbi:MAG: UDP-N-acetylmuramate dehydrogenase [Patescibacteria group bacterium]
MHSMLDVQKNVPLRDFTTFRIGGPAHFFIPVASQDELLEALGWARQHPPLFILGGGSNLLVADRGFFGTIIRPLMTDLKVSGTTVHCGAGATLLELTKAAGERGLRGLAKLTGIPGSVGGAVRGNAGAFGTEIKDFLATVVAVDARTGTTRQFSTTECEFGYRDSFFKRIPGWVVTEVSFKLQPGNRDELLREATETVAERNRRQIQDVWSAGSCFMNPTVTNPALRHQFESESGSPSRQNRIPAGWLIDHAGLRGTRVGGAEISHQHPNYIVNTGTATAADVAALINLAKVTVAEKFSVELHEEIQYVGFE